MQIAYKTEMVNIDQNPVTSGEKPTPPVGKTIPDSASLGKSFEDSKKLCFFKIIMQKTDMLGLRKLSLDN